MTGLRWGEISFLARLAGKNLTRYRRRTAITTGAVALGVGIFIAMTSLLQGIRSESERNLARYVTGSAAIASRGYWDDRSRRSLDRLVGNTSALLEKLEKNAIAAAPRVSFRGELIVHYDPYPEEGSLFLDFCGIDPRKDPAVFHLDRTIRDGRFLRAGKPEILLGSWLADQLGAKPGFPVTVITRTRQGFHQLLDLEVAGIFDTPHPGLNRSTVYLPLDQVQEDLELGEAVTMIHIALDEALPGRGDPTQAARLAGEHSPGEPLEVLTFHEMTREFSRAFDMQDSMLNAILLLLGLIAAVGITNTMVMAVLEREEEIAMMQALGMNHRELRLLFALEGSTIGAIGGLVGLVIGAGLSWYLVTWGIDYTPLLEDLKSDYPFSGVLQGVWSVPALAGTPLGAICLATTVALLPLGRMFSLPITDLLRRT
ncbi:hypothetical protein AU468_10290 [Alkalispirochaeta sphaeroplastigenens]|uniref:ABC3 transporter permease protein domain-containing protein n=1 Tax=Alkalispirochaeta sphaeroplastigenens TaxID=1187066 RepID=A0A2S4JJH7_9SPIO|nr:FtsX-like permease family protein [Alkalispirochaeta sphaeroplastigenens]POQ99688.1 hypothetical protein AU468_10290 [Alkalispirochaeta sphaeroplastigenens]